jgi:hypothetical protein
VKVIASGVLLLSMGVSVGLLGVHRFQISAVVILVASALVLVAWGVGFVRKFGRSGPLNDKEQEAAEARLRAHARAVPAADFRDEPPADR